MHVDEDPSRGGALNSSFDIPAAADVAHSFAFPFKAVTFPLTFAFLLLHHTSLARPVDGNISAYMKYPIGPRNSGDSSDL